MPPRRVKFFWTLLLSWLHVANICSAHGQSLDGKATQLKEVVHILEADETIGTILYSYGIGSPGSSFQLYGKHGFIKKVKALNPGIDNWQELVPGTPVKLLVPNYLYQKRRTQTHTTDARIKAIGVTHDDVQVMHIVHRQNSISTILFRYGIGKSGSNYKIYGSNGYLAKTKQLNPQILDWKNLPMGSVLKLPIPRALNRKPQFQKQDMNRPMQKAVAPESRTFHRQTPKASEPIGDVTIEHVVRENVSISTVLFRYGIGKKGSPFSLYGKNGYIHKTKKLNPQIDDWRTIALGSRLKLPIPTSLIKERPSEKPPQSARKSTTAGLTLLTENLILAKVTYTWQQGDEIFKILEHCQLGRKNALARLYDGYGWFRVTKIINPDVKNWTTLVPGTEINLLVPQHLLANANWQAHPERYRGLRLVYEVLALAPQQTLSQLLLERFQPALNAGTDVRLYGKHGFINRQKLLNPHITNWQDVPAGSNLLLTYPIPAGQTTHARLINNNATQLSAFDLKNQDFSIDTEQPEILKEQLTEENIAMLDAASAENISDETREEKAWDLSFTDYFKPGMDLLFKGLNFTSAGAYVGTRYGLSLSDGEDPLMKKFQFVGIVTELRDGFLAGLRFYWDYAPLVTTSVEGQEYKLGFKRQLFGWAFEFDLPFLADKMHFTPRVGLYSIDMTNAVAIDDAGTPIIRTVQVNGARAAGLETDVELAKFFFILRGWFAMDFAQNIVPQTQTEETVESMRYGLDWFIKGSGFSILGRRVSFNYLLFIANENVEISAEDAALGEYVIELDIPYAGSGIIMSF